VPKENRSFGNGGSIRLAENVGPELHKLWPTLVALRHDNPAISHHMSYPDGPPLMIEDLLPMSEWKRTAVFNEFYAKLEMRARLSLACHFRARTSRVSSRIGRRGHLASATARCRTFLDFTSPKPVQTRKCAHLRRSPRSWGPSNRSSAGALLR
jgi:hypothetical protein